MNTTLSSIEKMVLGISAVFVAVVIGFVVSFQGQKTKVSVNESLNINYDMAKAKSAENQFSLEGREIDRENQELEAEINKDSKVATNAKETKAAKKAEAAKAVASKKAAVADTKKKASPEKLAQNSKTTAEATDSKQTLETSDNNNLVAQNTEANSVAVNQEVDAATTPKAKKTNKTSAEWSKDIFASNDRQLILKFVAAYKNKEITESEFYSVINELLVSKDETKKGFGLYALRAAPSYASYVLLVKTQPSLNTTYQAYVQESLLSYHQANSLNYLRQALASNDKQIILKTLEIVKAGYLNVKNGTTASLVDSRYRRDTGYETFSLQNYLAFLPQLTQLQAKSQQSGDQDIYAATGQLLQAIQPVAAVASN